MISLVLLGHQERIACRIVCGSCAATWEHLIIGARGPLVGEQVIVAVGYDGNWLDLKAT